MGTRPDPADLQVICLGLGRTGTTSLRGALETLGFGPCYHMLNIARGGGKDFTTWSKIGDGNGCPDDFDALFRGYGSVADYPTAMYPAEIYAAYPDAKFILTTRDPEKWEKSMKSTVLRIFKGLPQLSEKSAFQDAMMKWSEVYCLGKYHRHRLYTNAQQEILDHNERVKNIIPPEKLLIYEVGEGWDRLVEFLGVLEPTTPFPHINDAIYFQTNYLEPLGI